MDNTELIEMLCQYDGEEMTVERVVALVLLGG
jgi:hypothetical protein